MKAVCENLAYGCQAKEAIGAKKLVCCGGGLYDGINVEKISITKARAFEVMRRVGWVQK